MLKKTALHSQHLNAGAKMTDFGGWDMPIHYGSQIDEHHAVRKSAGMFDVSHMTVVDLAGVEAAELLRLLLVGDVTKLTSPGQAKYSLMLNGEGGIIDDLIVYSRADGRYRLVVNAATRDKDLAWMRQHVGAMKATLHERDDLAMIAIQGPAARAKLNQVFTGPQREAVDRIARFEAIGVDGWYLARTGYTGEDGFEIMLPQDQAAEFWAALVDAGITPAGLGARDTLRLEAGMHLYGQDMDDTVSPLDCGLAWTIDWEPEERRFIGRDALEAYRKLGPEKQHVGLVLEGRGVLRSHMAVYCGDEQVGETTSGSYSPSLERSIAMARISRTDCAQYTVDVRGKRLPVTRVKPSFVRNGKPQI